jgi:hypothetical protein
MYVDASKLNEFFAPNFSGAAVSAGRVRRLSRFGSQDLIVRCYVDVVRRFFAVQLLGD